MDTDQTYTYKDLIHAYVDANYVDHQHPEVKDYYQRLLAALEQVYEVKLSGEGFADKKLSYWTEFETIAKACGQTLHAITVFEDQTTMNFDLITLIEPDNHPLAHVEVLINHLDDSLHLFYTALDSVFSLIFGEPETKITSKDLRAIGFDDRDELVIDFLRSWDGMERLFNYSFSYVSAEHNEAYMKVGQMIIELRKKGYDTVLRAGQSLSRFIVSRSEFHGLRAGQANIVIIGFPTRMEVHANFPDRELTSYTFDEIAFTPELQALLDRLVAEPIT